MIIAAAVKVTKDNKEFVIMGKRHHNCFETMYAAGVRRPWAEVQGFVNDKFEFLDRYDAWKEAETCNQILPNAAYIGTLFSEDLW